LTKTFYHNSHIPNELLFRDKERLKLLKFLLNGINTFIYGTVGSSKTTLLKSIIEELNSVNNAKVIYVDATLHQTTNSILREVLSSISPLSAISKSNSYLINRLKEKLRNRKGYRMRRSL